MTTDAAERLPCGECGQLVRPKQPHDLTDCQNHKAALAAERQPYRDALAALVAASDKVKFSGPLDAAGEYMDTLAAARRLVES